MRTPCFLSPGSSAAVHAWLEESGRWGGVGESGQVVDSVAAFGGAAREGARGVEQDSHVGVSVGGEPDADSGGGFQA